jgi:prevent-host-death family protein
VDTSAQFGYTGKVITWLLAKVRIMQTVTVEESQARLPELLEQVRQGKEILIVENNIPVAKLTAATRPGYGCLKGRMVLADDFDAPLDEFADYLP